jgi:hypothetical protein
VPQRNIYNEMSATTILSSTPLPRDLHYCWKLQAPRHTDLSHARAHILQWLLLKKLRRHRNPIIFGGDPKKISVDHAAVTNDILLKWKLLVGERPQTQMYSFLRRYVTRLSTAAPFRCQLLAGISRSTRSRVPLVTLLGAVALSWRSRPPN